MGAINYGRNDLINIGINPAIYDRMGDEDRFLSEKADFESVEYVVQKYDFAHFGVAVKPGYYEGFYISIEDPGYMNFDCKEEKREFIRELTKLKKMLLECCQYGMVQYIPGWVTGYSSEDETVVAIREAIRNAKHAAEKIPCWRTWERLQRKGSCA